ncbi:MAG: NAD-binding protein [Nitrospirae bacterium]|nr:NAD-binding protein [Nitrospirota bacterium]
MAGHFIVVGMGRVGYRVVDLLLRLGETVTVITDASREEWMHSVCERGATSIAGDARSGDRLLQAGLHTAKALIAATNQDLVNVEIALDAKSLRPDLPIVVRLFDQALAQESPWPMPPHDTAFLSLPARRRRGIAALLQPPRPAWKRVTG